MDQKASFACNMKYNMHIVLNSHNSEVFHLQN